LSFDYAVCIGSKGRLLVNRNRRRALIVGVIAAIGVLVSVAIVSAGHAPFDIVLILDGDQNEFMWGNATQTVEIDKAECRITDESRTGATSSLDGVSIIEMSASTYDNAGRLVQDAPIGLVEDGLGVNLRGNGNGQECGRVDYLGGSGGSLQSERLMFSLGDAIQGQMLSGVTFDLEAKYEPTVHFWFYRNGVLIDDHDHTITGGSDSGPDSKFRDKYKVLAEPGNGEPFDAIEVSMDSGGASVEGGATWIYSDQPGEEPENNRTVFHLVDVNASADIVNTTTSAVDGMMAAGDPFTWTWTVTNTGDVNLSNAAVSVSVDGGTGQVATCSSTSVNSPGFITCSFTDNAPTGAFDVVASFSSISAYGGSVTDSVTTGYFGVSSGIDVDALTNGVDGGSTLYIPVTTDVEWTYVVTNTGNAALSGVSVSDSQDVIIDGPNGDTNGNSELDTTETWVFTATPSGVAAAGPYSNTATVNATDLLGTGVSDTDSSGYFGSAPGVEISASLEDETVLPGEWVMWDITVTNTGNVDLTFVVVTEDGVEVCDLGTIADGEFATCDYDHEPEFGYNETTFVVEASAPPGVLVSETSDTYSYVGTLACDDAVEEGEPGISDTPLVSFSAGPNTKGQPCEVPLNLLSSVDPGTGVQTVTVAPPLGYSWAGVSGIVTIQWDGETVSTSPIARTVLGTDPSTDPVIRWCNDVVGVALANDGVSDLWYYELSPSTGIYPGAVTYGLPGDPAETCLVLQNTETVNDGGVIKTQTTEVFYIYNDPIFSR
jgi:hypothetical protein